MRAPLLSPRLDHDDRPAPAGYDAVAPGKVPFPGLGVQRKLAHHRSPTSGDRRREVLVLLGIHAVEAGAEDGHRPPASLESATVSGGVDPPRQPRDDRQARFARPRPRARAKARPWGVAAREPTTATERSPSPGTRVPRTIEDRGRVVGLSQPLGIARLAASRRPGPPAVGPVPPRRRARRRASPLRSDARATSESRSACPSGRARAACEAARCASSARRARGASPGSSARVSRSRVVSMSFAFGLRWVRGRAPDFRAESGACQGPFPGFNVSAPGIRPCPPRRQPRRRIRP